MNNTALEQEQELLAACRKRLANANALNKELAESLEHMTYAAETVAHLHRLEGVLLPQCDLARAVLAKVAP